MSERSYRVSFLGGASAGRTSLIKTLAEGSFVDAATQPSLGTKYLSYQPIETVVHLSTLRKDKTLDATLVDIGTDQAGRRNYVNHFATLYVSHSDAVVMCLNLDKGPGYYNIVAMLPFLLDLQTKHPNVPLIFLGTKKDIAEEKSRADIKKVIGRSKNINYLEVSAKTREGLAEFSDLLERLVTAPSAKSLPELTPPDSIYTKQVPRRKKEDVESELILKRKREADDESGREDTAKSEEGTKLNSFCSLL